MAHIGFIGLGVMGSAMASNLLEAGYDVTVFDLDTASVSKLVEAGATGAESGEEAVVDADIVFFSLPGPDAVQAVVDETASSFDHGAILVDLTTSTPETTNEIADRLAPDVDVLGAPVSGGAKGAEEGTLTIIAGGDAKAYEACKPLFEIIGGNSYHVGASPGHGHAVKLLNNFLSFTALAATSEAVILGEAAGLDPEILCDVFSVSTGRNSATQDKFPDNIIPGTYDAGFKLALMEKDMKLLSQFSEDQGVPLQIADMIENIVTYTRIKEGGEEDMTRTYSFLEDLMIR